MHACFPTKKRCMYACMYVCIIRRIQRRLARERRGLEVSHGKVAAVSKLPRHLLWTVAPQVHVCMRVCTHVCVRVRIYVCVLHVCNAYIYVLLYAYAYTCVCMCGCYTRALKLFQTLNPTPKPVVVWEISERCCCRQQ
jgi:hypothetical protein